MRKSQERICLGPIVQLKDNEVEVISTEGIHYLGGTDFDEKLQDFVIKKFKDDKNKNISKKDFNRMDAEELKISLSKREEKTIGVKNTNIKNMIKNDFMV